MDSDGDDDVDDEENSGDYVSDGGDVVAPPNDGKTKHYKTLNESDIIKLLDGKISAVSDALTVTRGTAAALLCRKSWSLTAVYDYWFSLDGGEMNSGGYPSKRHSRKHVVCSICYEETRLVNMLSAAACGHSFCSGCWKAYISTSINGGPGCLTFPCPEPGCKSLPDHEIIGSLASADGMEKYRKYLRRSYVESNREIKWCPGPGCDSAVQVDLVGSDDVACGGCSHRFCFGCAEESHRPVNCETVAKWALKNSSEAGNTTYILAYTKPCPKCKRAIEKNQGCNHMTCTSECGHQFCWICLAPWKNHNYSCNKFREEGVENDDEKNRRLAKKHLERYTHYYERWDSNDKSRKRAIADLERVRKKMGGIALLYGESMAKIEFVAEAWEQIMECRLFLKWTYAYGYYLSMEEKTGEKKLALFEYLQGEAEAALERLHHCAEKEMETYVKNREDDFEDFRMKLCRLTGTTKNYFENLVMAFENDLCEVESSSPGRRRKRSDG